MIPTRFPLAFAAAVLGAAAFAQSVTTSPEALALNDRLTLRYANGIVAAVEGRAITAGEVARAVAPLLPALRQTTRDDQEYLRRVDQLCETAVADLKTRAELIREFRRDASRHIPTQYVDTAIADDIAARFGGDRGKFLEHIRAQGLTKDQYRQTVEDNIIYHYRRGQPTKTPGTDAPPPAKERK